MSDFALELEELHRRLEAAEELLRAVYEEGCTHLDEEIEAYFDEHEVEL